MAMMMWATNFHNVYTCKWWYRNTQYEHDLQTLEEKCVKTIPQLHMPSITEQASDATSLQHELTLYITNKYILQRAISVQNIPLVCRGFSSFRVLIREIMHKHKYYNTQTSLNQSFLPSTQYHHPWHTSVPPLPLISFFYVLIWVSFLFVGALHLPV